MSAMRCVPSFLAVSASILSANVALAGECPADQHSADVTPPILVATGDVADETLTAFDLSEHYDMDGRLLRLRRITVAPGGVIGWHGHRERPGVLMILSGEMTEYRSTCRVPIVHRPGEGAAENGPFFHQWRNEGNTPAVILTADLPPAPAAR